MAENSTTKNTTDAAAVVETTSTPVDEKKAVAATKEVAAEDTTYRPRKGTTVKAVGLVNTVYLRAGQESIVTVTDQLLQLVDKGLVRLVRDNG